MSRCTNAKLLAMNHGMTLSHIQTVLCLFKTSKPSFCAGAFVLVHPNVEEQELLEVGRVINVKKYMEDGEGSLSHEEQEILVTWYLFDLDLKKHSCEEAQLKRGGADSSCLSG